MWNRSAASCGMDCWTERSITLSEAQILIETWRRQYDTVRPHSALGYRPPAPEAAMPPIGGLTMSPALS